MSREEHLFEQLDNIAKEQPVWDGDLISKNIRTELVKLVLIFRYEDKSSNDRRIQNGGYVLTELGKQVYKSRILPT